MSILKKIIADTAIYGTSNILSRGLNLLLTFFIAKIIAPPEFGVFTDLYAMVAFLLVVLTHGMETSFFRHVNILDKSKNVFGTAYSSVFTLASLFLLLALLFVAPIANGLKYPDQQNYITIFAAIIFFDVISAIPFANLRQQNKAKQFASIKVFNVVLTILLNLFFLFLCPKLINQANGFGTWISSWYMADQKVLYVFLSNLIASVVNFILLSGQLKQLSFSFDKKVYSKMLKYAIPIMLLGFAGTINEMFDRKILRFYLPYNDEKNLTLLGVYGFAYKLSIVMAMFLQAYKFAVEPILFAEAENKNAPATYARIMKYYVIAVSALFILVIFNLPLADYLLFEWIKYNPTFKTAIQIVPILLAANAFLGIYFNVATWYKVSDKTMYGAYIAFFGAFITIVLNLWWVPKVGIIASAWATLICYFSMTIVGLFIGQKYYPIPYQFSRLLMYLLLAASAFLLYYFIQNIGYTYLTPISIVLTGCFVFFAYRLEQETVKK